MYLIFGSQGALGLSFQRYFRMNGVAFLPFGKTETAAFLSSPTMMDRVEGLINCVSIPSERRSLELPLESLSANLIVPNKIADLALKYKKKFLTFSSHAVFSSNEDLKPYCDNDPPNPDTFYGCLKSEHEKKLSGLGDKIFSSIIRLPSLYGVRPGERALNTLSLLDRLNFMLAKGEEIRVDLDWIDTPVHYDLVPELALRALETAQEKRVIHIASEIMNLTDFLAACNTTLSKNQLLNNAYHGGVRARILSPSKGYRATFNC